MAAPTLTSLEPAQAAISDAEFTIPASAPASTPNA